MPPFIERLLGVAAVLIWTALFILYYVALCPPDGIPAVLS